MLRTGNVCSGRYKSLKQRAYFKSDVRYMELSKAIKK